MGIFSEVVSDALVIMKKDRRYALVFIHDLQSWIVRRI